MMKIRTIGLMALIAIGAIAAHWYLWSWKPIGLSDRVATLEKRSDEHFDFYYSPLQSTVWSLERTHEITGPFGSLPNPKFRRFRLKRQFGDDPYVSRSLYIMNTHLHELWAENVESRIADLESRMGPPSEARE